MSKILVVGASGTIGGTLVQDLRAKGHVVLSATSKPATAPGQVHLNLQTGAGLERAFEGVEKAFLMSPAGYTAQDELLAPLIRAASENKLNKVVLLSAMGANADDSAPLRKAELQLQASGLNHNIVRPNWFMQNFNSYWLEGIVKADTIALPVALARTSFIDARDIATTVAALLDGEQFANRDFDLTGSEALDHAQVAAILSEVIGRTIRYQDISPEQMLENLLAGRLPRPYAEFLVVILGFVKAGYAERTTDSVQQITGRAPIRFEQYARDFKAAWSQASAK